MKGYAGRILRVNLSKGKVVTEDLSLGMCREYIGGKGFGAKILFEEVAAKTDPYDPSNLLIFATGPLNGIRLSGASRFCALFKSPLTGVWGESECGGYFAPQLKYAGYDVVIIEGRSEKPVYVFINDEEVSVRNADYLWGQDTFEAEETIKNDNGTKTQVLSIGPAGENLVRYACIGHAKGRQFGRCGAGAVMGSKRLKALAVSGSGSIEISRPDKLRSFREELDKRIRKRLKSLTKYGTPSIIALTNTTGTLPTKYWREGRFEGLEKINAPSMLERIVKRKKACFACSVACGKISEIEEGPYAGTIVEGPEYETLYAFGSLCGNDNLESIAKANEICDRLGMDTISAGNAVAFAMECYEKGLITKDETEGENLTFGNHTAMVSLLGKIAHRKGYLGDTLSQGVRKASETIGKSAEKLAIHVKGLEPPGYDPRGLKGVALAYAVSCRGACHLRHLAYRPNLTGELPFKNGKIDRLSYKGQAVMVKALEDFYTLVDSMVLCKFLCLPTIGPILWNELTDLYSIVTGVKAKKRDLVGVATRINNLVRSFNTREGNGRLVDSLPERFIKERVDGQIVQKSQLGTMIAEYYKIVGT